MGGGALAEGSAMSYTVNEKARAIVFSCPHCAAELRRPLNEAGTRQPCPGCMSVVTVPGAEEVRAILRDERREAEDRRRIEAWAHSSAPAPAAAASEDSDAMAFPRAERLLPAPPSREEEALIHAFPAPPLRGDKRSAAAARRPDAAVRADGARFPAARVLLLLLVAALIAWFVAARTAGGW
jgi:hypothetical protein